MTKIIVPTGTVEGDKAAVIAASLDAKNSGEETVRLENGHWLLDGLTPTDIHDRYLVMDEGTFSPGSFLHPFKSSDWVGGARRQGNSGGRGRIAIEVDDSTIWQWQTLFPLTKKLGIPMSVAWHTDMSSTKWVHEAYRHGWELLSHLPYNIDTRTAYSEGILDDLAQQSLDAIHAIVGSDKPVGFVYPMHNRDAVTDQVLRKYYDRGRGVAGARIYSQDVAHDWLTSATQLDPHLTADGTTDSMRRRLRSISRMDGQMVFYMHWVNGSIDTKGAGLIDFVQYAQSLGIEIVTSGQIWGDKNLVDDPYVQGEDWISSGSIKITEDDFYHGGKSFKLAAVDTAISSTAYGYTRFPIPSKPGMYTKLRMSFRRKNTEEIGFLASQVGLRPAGTIVFRKSDDSVTTPGLTTYISDPDLGTALPPSDWEEHTYDVWLPPTVSELSSGASVQNLKPGGEIFLDDFRAVVVGYATEYVTTASLNGTANVFLYPPLVYLETRHYIHIEPDGVMYGNLEVYMSANRILVKSTSFRDKMKIRIRITPRESWHIDE